MLVDNVNIRKSAELSKTSTSNGWKASTAKVGTGIAAVLLTIGASIIDISGCILGSSCGSCRNFYIAINSGDVDGTYQGPTLLYQDVKYDWGSTCQAFTELITSETVGVGGVGSSSRTWMTGVDGFVEYTVLDLEGNRVSHGQNPVLQSPRYDRPREQTLGRGHT